MGSYCAAEKRKGRSNTAYIGTTSSLNLRLNSINLGRPPLHNGEKIGVMLASGIHSGSPLL